MMRFFRRFDILIIIGICASSFGLWLYLQGFNNKTTTAYLYRDGQIIETLQLSKDEYKYSPPGLPNVIIASKDGAVRFLSSDCPDKVCVNTGWLRAAHGVAVCVPNKLIIKLAPDSDTDMVVG